MKLGQTNNWLFAIAALGFSSLAIATPGNGVVVGNEAANQQKAKDEHVEQKLQNPSSFDINVADKTAGQQENVKNRLTEEVSSMLEQGKSNQGEFVAQWKAKGEAAALDRIDELVATNTLSASSLEVAKAFLRLRSSSYIKPTTALDAIENWPVESQRGFAMKIYQAVREQNKAAREGNTLSGDQAFESVLEDKQEYCAACGC